MDKNTKQDNIIEIDVRQLTYRMNLWCNKKEQLDKTLHEMTLMYQDVVVDCQRLIYEEQERKLKSKTLEIQVLFNQLHKEEKPKVLKLLQEELDIVSASQRKYLKFEDKTIQVPESHPTQSHPKSGFEYTITPSPLKF